MFFGLGLSGVGSAGGELGLERCCGEEEEEEEEEAEKY